MVFGFGKKKKQKKPAKKEKEIDVGAEIKEEGKKEKVNVQEMIEKGYVHARVILEILGAPKEHIENTLVGYVDKIKKQRDMHIIDTDFAETEKKDEFFSKFVEVEMLFRNPSTMIGFCFDFMPSSIEIIEPENPDFNSDDLSMLFNDLQARLHKMDMLVKQMKTENKNLRTNAGALLRNLAITILNQKPLDLAKLSAKMGIPEGQLKPFMDKIKEEGFVKEAKGVYSTADYKEKKAKPKKSIKKPKKKK